ncbi:hypothetical protein KPHES18084_04220 [Corynebacterium ulcerans]|uniref:Uncharacterized protein n=1 Tax=Corynebacterium ulcerans FRC58 TaxID=1408268 RepID=A0ABN4GRQ2_CORUL|nr:Hypothetical protein CulFRC58_0494 [Corynebacterium ulcerans FRC58]BDV25216.1 hypothetical protein CULTSU28_04640 [Corynebacterium ulcerans]STC78356.1 Uncharacterised protein [Corynebacterium ulcerans]
MKKLETYDSSLGGEVSGELRHDRLGDPKAKNNLNCVVGGVRW